jgi:hypothetical protein
MQKAIKIVAGLITVVLITIAVIIATTDINQYKGQIIDIVENVTGRNLQINGDLKFALSLVPTVIVEDVQLSNVSWGSKPVMISLKQFELKAALLPLITGKIHVNNITLINPEIFLETNKQGIGNWQFFADKKQAQTADNRSDAPRVVVNEVHIKNGTITYLNGVTGQQSYLVIDQLNAEPDGVNDPLSLIVEAAYNEIPISVTGHIGSFSQFTHNDNYPLDLAIEINDATLALNGQIIKPMSKKGLNIAVKFDVDSLAKLSSFASSKLPDLGPVKIAGTITDDKDTYSIKSLELTSGNTNLSGNATINFSAKKPKINAMLDANLIDFTEIIGDKQKKNTTKTIRVFSSTPLPLDILKSVNVNVSLTAKQIKTNRMTLADTKISMSLEDGLLIIKPLKSIMVGGKLDGSIDINTRGTSPILSSSMSITGFEPNQLPVLKDKLTGAKTDVNLNVRGTGNSISQIMASLSGKLLVKVNEGIITDSFTDALGADVLTELAHILNPFSQNTDNTQLQCAVINFDIKDGIATTNKGIAISTNQMNIVSSGVINLKTEGVDMGIKPQAKEGFGINAGKLASFVRVGGTLAHPQPTTDLTSAISTGLSVSTAFATGGLSLLAEGLFDRATSDTDPCATAWAQKSSTSQTTKPSEKSTSTKAIESVKSIGGTVSDTIKGLFD